ncbi:MAG TPA: DUF1553 domain-containing protein [Candidatus Hydrogenedentes bacterium]|nr:DUF1553 domain-containing protein [Candidatus Hydrogenedentota bacterium]
METTHVPRIQGCCIIACANDAHLCRAATYKCGYRHRRAGKRGIGARRIDALLESDAFADYWSLKWCDLLRVKSEFPINLWPNAVQAYHRWIHDALKSNMPYDTFARALLTSSGSNFRVPPVNFYRAVQGRTPASIAAAVALTFMGARVETWPEQERANLEAFFSRLAFKSTDEWKEEIVCLDPAPSAPLNAVLPDGTTLVIPADQDPRFLFAAWLTAPENEWFSRNIANRVWAWLFGRGVIHEPDDIRPDNPPSNPELLAYLQRELVRSNYDLRRLYRLILNSATYQQSSVPVSTHPDVERLFACYPVRPIEAEALVDMLNALFGGSENYESLIPEPFTYIPDYNRTITLADGRISSAFLETFGRPSRDTGLENERNNQTTEAQRLSLINSSHIQKRIAGSAWRIRRNPRNNRVDPRKAAQRIYLGIMSRYPTPQEIHVLQNQLRANNGNARETGEDLVWALINSKEFLIRH